eukprot:SAG31_NODE_604_length_13629_cov_11.035994_4_plen_197_part_00
MNVEGDTERTTASMHFLSNGDRWNSVTNEVEFAANKVPCNPLAEVLGSQTIFSSGVRQTTFPVCWHCFISSDPVVLRQVANDYRRVALEASRLSQPGATVENTHGSTFGAAPVYANFVTTPETVAMCDEDGEQGFSNLGTIQASHGASSFCSIVSKLAMVTFTDLVPAPRASLLQTDGNLILHTNCPSFPTTLRKY